MRLRGQQLANDHLLQRPHNQVGRTLIERVAQHRDRADQRRPAPVLMSNRTANRTALSGGYPSTASTVRSTTSVLMLTANRSQSPRQRNEKLSTGVRTAACPGYDSTSSAPYTATEQPRTGMLIL